MASDIVSVERLTELPRPALAHAAVRRMTGYRTAIPGVHRGLPSPWLTLVFPLSGEIPIEVPVGGGVRSASYAIPIGGLHTHPVYLPPPAGSAGRPDRLLQRGVQLEIHPLAARALFGLPAGELSGQVLDLSELLRSDAAQLTDDLNGGVGAERAAAVIRDWLTGRLGAATYRRQAPEVRRAWQLLVGSGGRRRVGDVAREVGWSRRHLTSRLRAETGLGAKDIARVTRFQHARSLVAGAGMPLAEVATTCGYADQSHLSTQWREFAGCTIGQWTAQELPWLSEPA